MNWSQKLIKLLDALLGNIKSNFAFQTNLLTQNHNALITQLEDNNENQINSLPFDSDSFQVTSRDANDNPTTIEYSKNGSVIKTVTITYTVDGDVDSYTVS